MIGLKQGERLITIHYDAGKDKWTFFDNDGSLDPAAPKSLEDFKKAVTTHDDLDYMQMYAKALLTGVPQRILDESLATVRQDPDTVIAIVPSREMVMEFPGQFIGGLLRAARPSGDVEPPAESKDDQAA